MEGVLADIVFLMWLLCCKLLTVSLWYPDVAHTLDEVWSYTIVELNDTSRNNEPCFHMHVNTSVISTLLPLTSTRPELVKQATYSCSFLCVQY